MRLKSALFAVLLIAGCRDRTSFAPNISSTPIPAFAFNGVLATYNNPAMGAKETSTLGSISVSTDRSKIEFPSSTTSGILSTVPAGSGGVGSGRALRLDYNLPSQGAQFAGCLLATPCDCATSYAYLSISHQLVPDGSPAMDVSGYTKLSFWLKSDVAVLLGIALTCLGETRPLNTVAPNNGYVDSAFTVKNPCWYAASSKRVPGAPYSNPMAVGGGATWTKYSIPLSNINDVSAPGPSTGVTLPCGLTQIRSVDFTLGRDTGANAGQTAPVNGTVYFDDLVFE